MGDVVNLKRFKKRVARGQSEKQAESNRAKFGQTKSERDQNKQLSNRASELLNQHRINGEEPA